MLEPVETMRDFFENNLQGKIESALDHICAVLKEDSSLSKSTSAQEVLKSESIKKVQSILRGEIQGWIRNEVEEIRKPLHEAGSSFFKAVEGELEKLEKGAAKVVHMLLPESARETMKDITDATSKIASQMDAASGLLLDTQEELSAMELFLKDKVEVKIAAAQMVYTKALGDGTADEYPKDMSLQDKIGSVNPMLQGGAAASAVGELVKEEEGDSAGGAVRAILDELKGKLGSISRIAAAVEHLVDSCPLDAAKAALQNALPRETLKGVLQDVRGMMSSRLPKSGTALEELRSLAEGVGDIGELLGEAEGIWSEGMGIFSDLHLERQAKKDKWRAREVAAFVAQQVVASPNSEGPVRTALNEALTKRKVFEFQPQVKAILDADGTLPQQVNEFLYGNGGDEENEDAEEERQEQQKTLWLEHEAKIVEDIKLKMEALEALREEAEKEANVLKKQELLVRCRKEQAILEAASTNISDVGKKLDMVIKFLGTMHSRLAEMDGKLAAIQDEVTALHEDMRRLTGKPVLDVYEEWRQRLLEEAKCVQKGVYIESEVVRAGPKNNFQEDETDNPKRLVTGAVREFLEGARATVNEVHEKEGLVTVSFDDPVGSAFPEEYRLRKKAVPRPLRRSLDRWCTRRER